MEWQKCVADVEAVTKFFAQLPGNLSEDRKHESLLKYMSGTLHSCQYAMPAIGRLVEKATVDPLHIMNNAWEFWLSCVVSEALALSGKNHT